MQDLILPNNTDSNQYLFFFYKPATKEVLFSNLAVEDFFETPLNLHLPFPFTSFDPGHKQYLEAEWQHCQQLKEKETRNFNFQTTPGGITVLFNFVAVGISLPVFDNSRVVLFSVKKNSVKNNSLPKGNPDPIYQKDYAEFIDLATHDLDAPLRKLTLLIERVTLKYRTEPGSDMEPYFDRIQTNLTEMRSLVDSLSRLSALDTVGPGISCDTNMIIGEVLNALRKQAADKKIEAKLTALPVLEGDKEQYRQLFQNLLQNAIRFSKNDETLYIEISSTLLPDAEKIRFGLPVDKIYFYITIKDNGIGFERQYAEKIFRPFVRLHGKSEYPGPGIGLAICKKITENHGGTIYAEVNETNGTTITIILPQSL